MTRRARKNHQIQPVLQNQDLIHEPLKCIASQSEDTLNKSVLQLIHKIQVVHLHGGSIVKYLKEAKGISNWTLIGDGLLIEMLQIEQAMLGHIAISSALSVSARRNLDHISVYVSTEKINIGAKVSKGSVLICAGKKDEQYYRSILEVDQNIKIYNLTDIVTQVYYDTIFMTPLRTFKAKHPNVPVVILRLTNVREISNKSAEENMIVNTNRDYFTLRAFVTGDPPVIPEAIARYSSDPQYARDITAPRQYAKIDGILYGKDMEGNFVNIESGFRVTHHKPKHYNGTIYLFGSSLVYGVGVEDQYTISSQLQQQINEYASIKNIDSKLVLNRSNYYSLRYDYMFDLCSSMDFTQSDIVVVCAPNYIKLDETVFSKEEGYFICETNEAFQRPHKHGEMFIDLAHVNREGYSIYAQCLLNTLVNNDLCQVEIRETLSENSSPISGLQKSENACLSEYANELYEYKKLLSQTYHEVVGRIGSIVMNCNPFTLGHQYLIEYAASRVKHLFIFVVEENKSYFTFADRFELVKEGTAHLPNVSVLPSGKFIISSITFADYFDKSEIQDKTIDPSQDVELFATEIAPTLGISVRFAGEEPLDLVTNQYNNAMKKILPQHGIVFEVIPRKTSGDEVISASRVRKLLETKDFDAIKKIVPETTLKYLKTNYS